MPIICFEGPSAVGKTTTAEAFRADDGVFTVSEVNALFDRPKDEPADWYLERQVERCILAKRENQLNHPVILDGDPFQPLWYGWAYGYIAGQNLDFIEQLYKTKILDGTLAFPDLYIIFSTSEDRLRSRRKGDTLRQRRNFEKHLEMIEPQQHYFHAMNRFSLGRVQFLEAENVYINLEFIRKNILGIGANTADESLNLFENMIAWLRKHRA